MKKLIHSFFLCCLFSTGIINAQNPSWVATCDPSGQKAVSCTKNDSAGNSYIVGSYNQASAKFGNTTLACSGYQDIFVAKCDSNGNFIWAKRAGGASAQFSTDNGNGLVLDNSENLYVSGDYRDTADFSGIILPGKGLRTFLTKYDSSGNVIWISRAKGNNLSLGSVAINADTTLFVHGSCFTGAITLNEGTPDSIVVPNNNNSSFFVKYDTSGKASLIIFLPQTAFIRDITTDNNNGIYVLGRFYATASFGSTVLTCNGTGDIFTAKYDGNTGNLMWIKKIGLVTGNEQDNGIHLVMDAYKNMYIAGYRDDTGGIPSKGRLIKCDSIGNIVWSKVFTSSNTSYVTDLILINNNLYITGFYRSALTFDVNNTLPYNGTSMFSIYVGRYDTAGNILYSFQGTSGNNANNYGGLETDISGSLYLSGTLSSSTAAPISLGNITIMGNRSFDVFVAKYNPQAITAIAKSDFDGQVDIYPNPVKGILTVQPNPSFENYTVTIFNMVGQKILDKKNVIDGILIDMSTFDKGMYFVRIDFESKSYVKKIIVN